MPARATRMVFMRLDMRASLSREDKRDIRFMNSGEIGLALHPIPFRHLFAHCVSSSIIEMNLSVVCEIRWINEHNNTFE